MNDEMLGMLLLLVVSWVLVVVVVGAAWLATTAWDWWQGREYRRDVRAIRTWDGGGRS